MNRYIIAFIGLLAFEPGLFSQNSIDSVIAEVEKNNTTLSAFRKNADAELIGNKTGKYLQNPGVGFNYLTGDPSTIGNRTDFSIVQSFDFPSAYAYKNQISDYKNKQVELEYQNQYRLILLQTRQVCNELIYLNALRSEYRQRLNNAQVIATSYKRKFDTGETNILEFNKSQIALLNLSKDAENNEIERNLLLAELTRLNGGISIDIADSIFQWLPVNPDFDEWFLQAEPNNPSLKWAKQQVAISQKEEKLNTALSLPKIQAGYMSEMTQGQEYRGLMVGLTVPLWENKNAIKYAKAKTIAMQKVEIDAKLQFYNEMKALHTKVVELQKSISDYRSMLSAFNNTGLLLKALNMGEISLTEYILELSVYYESTNKLLEMELKLNKAIAELNQFEK